MESRHLGGSLGQRASCALPLRGSCTRCATGSPSNPPPRRLLAIGLPTALSLGRANAVLPCAPRARTNGRASARDRSSAQHKRRVGGRRRERDVPSPGLSRAGGAARDFVRSTSQWQGISPPWVRAQGAHCKTATHKPFDETIVSPFTRGLRGRDAEGPSHWIANAQLQAMGIYPLALPDAFRSYQMGLDIEE